MQMASLTAQSLWIALDILVAKHANAKPSVKAEFHQPNAIGFSMDKNPDGRGMYVGDWECA